MTDTAAPSLFAQDFLTLHARLRRSLEEIADADLLALRVQFYGEQAGKILLAADECGAFDDDETWTQLRHRVLEEIRDRLAAPGQFQHILFVEAVQRWLSVEWPERIAPAPDFLVWLYDHNSEHRFYLMLWPRQEPEDPAERLAFKRRHAELYAASCAQLARRLDPELTGMALGDAQAAPASDFDAAPNARWSEAHTKKTLAAALGMGAKKFNRFAEKAGLRREGRTSWRLNLSALTPSERTAVESISKA